MVCLLGGNASGKTTTLKTILGYLKPSTGSVYLDGDDVNDWNTARRVARGVTMVPENRRLFKRMTVRENLEIGAFLRTGEDLEPDFERVFELFPRVKERLAQKAGTLSGGEQQMVAMGRALMARPKVLLMDEPSMGLAPVLVAQNFEIIERINAADDGLRGRAERQHGTLDRRPGLCPPDGEDRARRHCIGAVGQPSNALGLPWRGLSPTSGGSDPSRPPAPHPRPALR